MDKATDFDNYAWLGFMPAATRRSTQEIVSQIRNIIISGKLKPGDKLPSERELIAIFKCSRPTVREAFRMLEEAGLINVVGGVGAIVCEPDLMQLIRPLSIMLQMKKIAPMEIVEMRFTTELVSVEWAALRRTEEDLAAMETILQKAEGSIDDWDESYKIDRDFHEAISEAAKNSLSKILNIVLRDVFLEAASKGFERLNEDEKRAEQKEQIEHHRKLLQYIEQKDIQKCKIIMEEHVEQFKRLIDTDKQ